MKADVDPSDSAAQRFIEVAILERVTDGNAEWTRVAWIDVATEYRLPAVWRKAKPDAVWESKSGELIVGECYTRVETLKPGNYGKLAKDTLKLLGIRNALAGKVTVRCLMIMPSELAKQLHGGGWLATSIREAVEIVPVLLLDAELISLKAAALTQADGQSRARRKSELSK
jgi:hypothetical protein